MERLDLNGCHHTPAALAAQVVRRVLAPFVGRAVRVCDPACGDGVFLVEARRFLGRRARLFGADIDADAVGRARERVDAEIRCGDALRIDWGTPFDAVVGNPPWISFSGRHARPPPDGYTRTRGWPSLHARFLELAVRICRGRIGLLLPAQVLDLDGYGPVRAFVRGRCRGGPGIYFGEDAFSGVTQPCAAVLLECCAGGSPGGSAPFPLEGAAEPDPFADFARAPAATFGDIGVHTGNCAKRLLRPGGVAMRVGRDVRAYRLAPPRNTITSDIARRDGEYFRVGMLESYRSVPILLRQTAPRPIAALHVAPTYFRNSVLACRGIDGVPHELVVAWLNSSLVGRYHRSRVREASQRSFPQLKIKHLRDLPAPDWPTAPRRLTALARAVARDGRLDLAPELEGSFARWFDPGLLGRA